MDDERRMTAAYAANPDEDHRLILADWFEERGDPRGAWLRDPELAPWMGPEAADPVPALIAGLADREQEARRLLVRIGPRAAPALMAARAKDCQRIDAVLSALVSAVPALPGLLERLGSDDPREQESALQALGEVGEAAAPALPRILLLLQEDRQSLRRAVIAALRR